MVDFLSMGPGYKIAAIPPPGDSSDSSDPYDMTLEPECLPAATDTTQGAVVLSAPSTDSADAGKAADAKDTGDALASKVDKTSFNALSGVTLSDGATQAQMRTVLKSILDLLQSLAPCLLFMALPAFSAVSGMSENVKWDDVPPTNTVKDVIQTVIPISTNQYALFIIPVDPTNGYREVELKGTDSNFDPNNDNALRFLYNTGLPQYAIQGLYDGAFLFVTGRGGDARKWTRLTSSGDIREDLGQEWPSHFIVLVSPDLLVAHNDQQDNRWLCDRNDSLIWVYTRHKDAEREKDSQGNTIWHPIMPVRWYNTLPTWASQ